MRAIQKQAKATRPKRVETISAQRTPSAEPRPRPWLKQSESEAHGQRAEAQADQVDDEEQDRRRRGAHVRRHDRLGGAVDRAVPEVPRKALTASISSRAPRCRR